MIVTELQLEWDAIFTPHSLPCTSPIPEVSEDVTNTMHYMASGNNFTCTAFDLLTRRFILHCSTNKANVSHELINIDNEQNSQDVNHITHPDDLPYSMRAEIDAYHHLMSLTPENQKNFVFIYFRRLKNNRGGYDIFLHRVSMIMHHQYNKPRILSTKTEHLPTISLELFLELRKSGYYLRDKNVISCNCSLILALKLTEKEMDILCVFDKAHTLKQIADMVYIAESTMATHSASIRRKFKTYTLYQAWQLFVKMGLNG